MQQIHTEKKHISFCNIFYYMRGILQKFYVYIEYAYNRYWNTIDCKWQTKFAFRGVWHDFLYKPVMKFSFFFPQPMKETVRGTPLISADFQPTLIACQIDNWCKLVYLHYVATKWGESITTYLFC